MRGNVITGKLNDIGAAGFFVFWNMVLFSGDGRNATSGIFRKFPDFSGFEMSGLVCESEIRKLFPHHNSR